MDNIPNRSPDGSMSRAKENEMEERRRDADRSRRREREKKSSESSSFTRIGRDQGQREDILVVRDNSIRSTECGFF